MRTTAPGATGEACLLPTATYCSCLLLLLLLPLPPLLQMLLLPLLLQRRRTRSNRELIGMEYERRRAMLHDADICLLTKLWEEA